MSNPEGLTTLRGFRWYINVVEPNVEPAIVSAFEIEWPARYQQAPNGPETHWYWVMDYFYTPGAKFRVGKNGPWKPRLPFVVNLYRPDSFYWHNMKSVRETSRSIYFSIRGGDALNFGKYLAPGMDYCQFADPDHYVGSRLQDLVAVGESEGNAGFLQAQVILFQILAALQKSKRRAEGRHVIQMLNSPKAPNTSLVTSARRYMEKHLAEAVTLKQLAKQANLSVSAFSQQFKTQMGLSPMQVLARLRMQRVKEMLLRGETLRNIAEATGFCDAYHLSRRFKQMEHMPPRMFLKRLNEVFSPEGKREI